MGPMKLTKDAARHAALGPLMSSAGRREMSRWAATSRETCTRPVTMVPILAPGDISFQVFFFRAARFLLLAMAASFRCTTWFQSTGSGTVRSRVLVPVWGHPVFLLLAEPLHAARRLIH